jgi:DNA-binding NarL/FixJ family response regulator
VNSLEFEIDALTENAKTLKVLYIENHAGTRLKLSRILKHYFGDVFVTAYADNGLKLFENGHFNLVITSSMLPDMSATNICKNIKEIAPKKPIVIVSKNKEPDEIIDLVNIGIAGYILTPLDETKILHILSRIVLEISDLEMIYSFQDSMVEEYFKLDELVDYTNFKNDSTSNNDKEISELLNNQSEKSANNVTSTDNGVLHDLLDEENIDMLLTKYEKISAEDFLDDYPIDLHLTGDSLFSLTEDIELHMNKFINEPSREAALTVANEFKKFAETLHPISVFSNMYFSVNKLAMIFESLDYTKSYKEYYDILLATSETLMRWCKNIFIDSTADDIHYFDKQFLSDTLKIESLFRSMTKTY